MKKKNNIIKLHKRLDINIGFLIFAIILIYLIVSVIIYITSKKVNIYQVSKGSLTQNNIYTGLIIRDESVLKSDYSGTLNYYFSNGDKADKVSVLCSIDETGHVSELLEKYADTTLSNEDQSNIKKLLSEYTSSYSDNNFDKLYSIKNSTISKLKKTHYNLIINDLDDILEQSGSTTLFHKVKSIKPGIIMLSVDGCENLKEEKINSSYFNDYDYNLTDLTDTKIINEGDTLYRLINSDNWYVYIPLNALEVESFSDCKKLNIRFVDNDLECTCNFSIETINGDTYGKLSLNKYMINFADRRFINIEITEESKAGLKIPILSVSNKSFYTIPVDYITASGNFVRVTYTSNGGMNTEPINATIYDKNDKYYFVSMRDFSSGDIILKPDSNEQYVIGTMDELTGVYCVNKGYAVFKKVDIIDKNDEYYIVRRGTNYGLKVYDHIVLDFYSVKEDELINS